MTAGLQIGVLLPTRGALLSGDSAQQTLAVLELAEQAEAAGCHSVWVGDSLTAKPRLDPMVTLGAIAARTRRVRIGTAVLLGALYQPVLLARAAASLDLLSGGRLVLAMGVGGAFTPGQEREWAAAGVAAQQRAGRLQELAQLLPLLWSGEAVTFQGRHFHLDQVTLQPRPLQRPSIPLWLACHHHTGTEVQYRRAGRWAGGIISITDSPDEYALVLERVRACALEYGREPNEIEPAFYMTVNLNPNPQQARAEAGAFIREYYGTDWWGDRWGPFGPPEAIIQRARAYAAAGARHLIFRLAAFDQAAQMERFERYVLPDLLHG